MNSERAALAVAELLIDPDVVLASVQLADRATLADGLPGTALLHARLSHLDRQFEQAAIAHWARAAELATRPPSFGGVYHVLGGLTASLVIGSAYLPDPSVNAAASDRAVRWASGSAVALAEQHAEFLSSGGRGTPWHVYDAISGLAGLGRVLLAAALDGHASAEPGLEAALEALTAALAERDGRPGWWAAPDQHPPTVAAAVGPSGAATTGIAHGVAGPLAALACATTGGYAVPGQGSAIRNAGMWLLHWRTEPHRWAPYFTGDELDAGISTLRPGRNTAWCYGVPGISRALLLAGQALEDAALAAEARTSLAGLADRTSEWDAEGPTLCHGHAGVLCCAAGVDHDLAAQATTAVMDDLEPERPFLFTHGDRGERHDNPGFLTGAAGVALALAEHANLPSAPVRTPWGALLLLG